MYRVVKQDIEFIRVKWYNKNTNNQTGRRPEDEKEEKYEKKDDDEVDLEKKDDIFPELTDVQRGNSFFDENEFDDLSDYMDDEKKGWF